MLFKRRKESDGSIRVEYRRDTIFLEGSNGEIDFVAYRPIPSFSGFSSINLHKPEYDRLDRPDKLIVVAKGYTKECK